MTNIVKDVIIDQLGESLPQGGEQGLSEEVLHLVQVRLETPQHWTRWVRQCQSQEFLVGWQCQPSDIKTIIVIIKTIIIIIVIIIAITFIM